MAGYDRELVAQMRGGLANKKKQAQYNRDPRLWANERLGVHLWSVQKEIIESVRDNKRTTVASCHGSGKALHIDTRIPVPVGAADDPSDPGYILMKDIQVGDLVIGSDKLPTTVTAVTPEHVHTSTDVYFLRDAHTVQEATPEDTAWVTASLEHQWNVLTLHRQANIRLLCHRRGITNPDWSYWMHRTSTHTTRSLMHTMKPQMATNEDYYVVPGARHVPTAVSRGYSGSGRLADIFARYGTVDRNGRLCIRVNAPVNPKRSPNTVERALKGIRGYGFPAVLMEAETDLHQHGYKTNATRRKRGHTYVYELAVHSDPRDLLSSCAPMGKHEDGMSDLDAQAIILQRADERFRRERVGGWCLTGTSYIRDEIVKCIEVDADDHLYLAGPKGVPTHNSMIASVASAWWIDTHPAGTAIVVSTAPTYPQVHAILWEEIRKHHARAKMKDPNNPLPGSVTMADNWNLPDGVLAGMGRKPKDGDQHAFQGIHRRFVLVIIDEACGVPAELWTGAEAITTNDGCRILVIGNPDDRDTDFGKSFEDPTVAHMWNRIRIPASVTPNLTGEPVPPLLNEVLVSKQWCDDALHRWGVDDPRYISKVLARFPEANEASLFNPAVIATGFEHNGSQLTDPPYMLYFGLDCARYGGDLNALTMYDGNEVEVIESWGGMDTVSTAMKALGLIEDRIQTLKAKFKDIRLVVKADIRVDAVGLGAGVVDTMASKRAEIEQELLRTGSEETPWFIVREMVGSAAPPKNVGGSIQGYGNARAFWYDQAKHMMRANAINIKEHAKLKEELEGVRYKYKAGKLYIESKEEMRDRGVKSPDFADSFVYAVAPVHEGLSTGDTVTAEAAPLAEVADLEEALMKHDIQISPY